MTTTLRSKDERMAMNRMFGVTNPDTYSPGEYAACIGPVLETMLKAGPIGVRNSALDPGNRGVALTLVMERTFVIDPSAVQGKTKLNDALRESGQMRGTDFEAFVASLFEELSKLTSVTLQDSLNRLFTLTRKDVKMPARSLAESGPLDLSVFSKPRIRGSLIAEKSGRMSDDRTYQFIGRVKQLKKVEIGNTSYEASIEKDNQYLLLFARGETRTIKLTSIYDYRMGKGDKSVVITGDFKESLSTNGGGKSREPFRGRVIEGRTVATAKVGDKISVDEYPDMDDTAAIGTVIACDSKTLTLDMGSGEYKCDRSDNDLEFFGESGGGNSRGQFLNS